MPTNHGIYRKLPTTTSVREPPAMRYGIWQVFDLLRGGSFLVDPTERRRAAQLVHHFTMVCHRFVFAMQDLNRLMQDFAGCYSQGKYPTTGVMQIRFQAECLADHVLTFLSTVVDDVAIVIALSTGVARIDSISTLRSPENRDNPALAPVMALIKDLDRDGSWWNLGFRREQGARQLLLHNQHLVEFQGSSAPGGPFKVQAFLISPYQPGRVPWQDFFGLLGKLLNDLFVWLDRLQTVLMTHLRETSSAACPRILLPVGYPPGMTRYDADYFPIPLCLGSDPLPWTISVQSS